MRLMPLPPSQPWLQVRGTCPSASGFATPLPARGEPLAGTGRGDVLSLLPYSSESLTSPIPPAPRVPPANTSALMDQSHPTKAASSSQLRQQTCSHTHTAAGPRGSVRGAAGHAAPPGRGEAGLRRAEDGGGRDGEGLEGALVSCGQNTLVSLQHRRRPSPPSGLQLGPSHCCHLSQVAWQPPPRGILSQIQVGGVGEGRG